MRIFTGLAVLFVDFAIMTGAAWPESEYRLGELVIEHPYIRETPPEAKVASGYLKLSNEGSSSDRLIALSTDLAERTEIHEMQLVDDVMTMRRLEDGLEIPEGGAVELKPGGFHLMFVNITKAPLAGERYKVKLVFEKAGAVDAEFTVEPMGVNPGTHSHHSD